MAPTIERSWNADDRSHRHCGGAGSAGALRTRRSGVSTVPVLPSVGDLRRQRERRVRTRFPDDADDGTALDGPLAAVGARDRLTRRLHDVLDAVVRDVPAARGRRTRPGCGEHARQRRCRSLRRIRRSRRSESAMKLEGEGKLLRLFIGESDTWHGKPLYQAIVERVRQEGLAGATVVRGIEGFGADSRLHTSRILRLSEDLPVVIEIVDTPEQIDRVVPILDEMVGEGMLTLERVQVVSYRSSDE